MKKISHKFNWSKLFKEREYWNKKIIQDLRSNHAGETGAVYIYKGALHASQIVPANVSSKAINFSKEHLETEKKHLDLFEKLFNNGQYKSKLLPLWKISGYSLGFFPTLFFGDRGLFLTVGAVETFVEKHYMEQIKRYKNYPETIKLLNICCNDEIHHKEEANLFFNKSVGFKNNKMIFFWQKIIENGSSFAVSVCKKI